MKKFFFTIAALLPALAFAQNAQPFTIQSKLSNITGPAKAYLAYYLGANSIIDSATIVNGEFKFEGVIMDPVMASLFIDHKNLGFDKYRSENFPDGRPQKTVDGLGFFMEKGSMTITGKDSIATANIIGSAINDDDKTLKTQLKAITDKGQKITDDAQKAPVEQQRSAAFQNATQAKYTALQNEQRTMLKNFITTHPTSYISLLALSNFSGPAPDVADVEPLYNLLSADLKNTEGGKQLKMAMDALRLTSVGAMAPDFSENDVNGLPVQLSSFRGKYVLIDFWASWCRPCRQENPNVVKLYNKYKGKGFTVLGVSLDRPGAKDAWLAAIKNDGLTWTQVSDLKGWSSLAASLYGVQSIPQNFLIDPQGKIVAKGLRGDDLDIALEKLLGKI
jgi:peroxiredoxin